MKISIAPNLSIVWVSSHLGGFDVTRQGSCKPWSAVRGAANQTPTHPASQPGQVSHVLSPERRHDLKGGGVCKFITMQPKLYLSHLFLPLWHWENCLQSLGGTLASLHLIHHESSLQRMDHFHACSPACLLACLRLSSPWMLPPCTAVISLCLLQLPSAQARITPDTAGLHFSSAHQESTVMATGQ